MKGVKTIVLGICQECFTLMLQLWGTGEGFWVRDMITAGLWKVGDEMTRGQASLLEQRLGEGIHHASVVLSLCRGT